MYIALLHSHFSEEHLDEVKKEMELFGAPVIKAIYNEVEGLWMACEGCHRIRAAAELGLAPIINDVTAEKTICIDWDGDPDTEVNVSEVLDVLSERINKTEIIIFE